MVLRLKMSLAPNGYSKMGTLNILTPRVTIMKKLLAAALIWLAFNNIALAQIQVLTVTTCGTLHLPVNQLGTMYMDLTGELCTNASVGGGGALATDAHLVAQTAAIQAQGTTQLALENGGNLASEVANSAVVGSGTSAPTRAIQLGWYDGTHWQAFGGTTNGLLTD